jgi:hypothetical protein
LVKRLSPFILLLYALSLAVGVLLVGSAFLLLFCVYCFLMGSSAREEKKA